MVNVSWKVGVGIVPNVLYVLSASPAAYHLKNNVVKVILVYVGVSCWIALAGIGIRPAASA